MGIAVWTVKPLLSPWKGDKRRNPEPYFMGRDMGRAEYAFATSVKRILESRGIACYVELTESGNA